ncbi:MAG: nucleoside triphosphate pyrophosphohydrolase [Kiritimatiellae bacterium]|nr:nucleoside triphosphate pyrophosphohydrolase [Kiritimatiellia bacterium]
MSLPARPIDRLLEIMRTLRSPGGCPWDRQQTLATLKPYLLEECHEEMEAIDRGDPDRIREELGDVLLQVVFQSQICSEAGWFDFEDVAATIADKLIRRHPHVFGEVKVSGAEDVLRNWEAIKRKESGDASASAGSRMEGVPRTLPALRRADQIQQRAARVGFDWPDRAGVFEKLQEEVRELRAATATADKRRVSEELGDVLFTLVNLARAWGVDAEDALREATDKFIRRFRRMEERAAADGTDLSRLSPEELDAHWNAVKAEEAPPEAPR